MQLILQVDKLTAKEMALVLNSIRRLQSLWQDVGCLASFKLATQETLLERTLLKSPIVTYKMMKRILPKMTKISDKSFRAILLFQCDQMARLFVRYLALLLQ